MQLFKTNFASLDLVNYTHQILQSLAYTVNVTIYRDDNDFIFTRTPKKVFFLCSHRAFLRTKLQRKILQLLQVKTRFRFKLTFSLFKWFYL